MPRFASFVLQKKADSVLVAVGTLNGELGLRFNCSVAIVGHAGVDTSILLCEIGDLETASSQQLHMPVTEDAKKEEGMTVS